MDCIVDVWWDKEITKSKLDKFNDTFDTCYSNSSCYLLVVLD